MNPANRAPLEIALIAVVSSQLASFGYSAPAQTLAIRFNTKPGEKEGPLYHYFGVEPATAQALSTADSKGSFFLAHIKKKYDYQKIEPILEDVQQATQERTYVAPDHSGEGRATAGQSSANDGEGAAAQG